MLSIGEGQEMSSKGHRVKSEQLGMNHSTAQNRLRKMILFQCIQRLNEDICFQCGQKIESVGDLSIEHIVPWLHADNVKELFWDLENIAFSHITCNSGAARKPRKGLYDHPSFASYNNGCRCQECRDFRNAYEAKRKQKLKMIPNHSANDPGLGSSCNEPRVNEWVGRS